MTLKHASAYLYGLGMGALGFSGLNPEPLYVSLVAALIFTVAYIFDKKSESGGDSS